MRITIASLSAVMLLQSLAAQVPENNTHLFFVGESGPFSLLHGATVSTRMDGATTSEVECLVEINNGAFRGVGAVNPTTCNIASLRFLLSDRNPATPNGFRWIVRRPVAPNGLPDGSPAGVIATSGVITLPLGSGIYEVTTTFVTPVAIPCDTGYFVGLALLAESPTDFLVTYAAGPIVPGATPPSTTLGDNPVMPPPRIHACRVDQPSGTASRPAVQRSLAIVTMTAAATMNIGNVDSTVGGYTSYGLGGLYPAIKGTLRDDGLSARVQDAANAGGVAAVFMSTGFSPGIPIAGISGALWVDPATLIMVAIGGLPTTSPHVFTQTFASPGSILAAPGRTLAFTALTFGAAGGRLTNAQAVTF